MRCYCIRIEGMNADSHNARPLGSTAPTTFGVPHTDSSRPRLRAVESLEVERPATDFETSGTSYASSHDVEREMGGAGASRS